MSKRTRAFAEEIETLNKKLDVETEDTLARMMRYLRLRNVGRYNRLRIQRDLAQQLLAAKAQGHSMEDVVGSDQAAFCEALIAALPAPTPREKRLRVLRNGIIGLALFWFICFVVTLVIKCTVYSSFPGGWEAAVKFHDVTTDIDVTPVELIVLVFGVAVFIYSAISSNKRQARKELDPSHKETSYIGKVLFVLGLNFFLTHVPIPDVLQQPLFAIPLVPNLLIQAGLIVAAWQLYERVD